MHFMSAPEFHENLRSIRLSRGFSGWQLASLAGCNVSTIYAAETKIPNVTAKTTRQIAKALGFELLEEEHHLRMTTQELHQKLRYIRIQRGLTQVQLGKLANVSSMSISHIELGGISNAFSIWRIANALNIEVYAQKPLNNTVLSAEQVRLLRRKLGMSARQLAASIGMSMAMIYTAESGQTKNPHNLQKIGAWLLAHQAATRH